MKFPSQQPEKIACFPKPPTEHRKDILKTRTAKMKISQVDALTFGAWAVFQFPLALGNNLMQQASILRVGLMPGYIIVPIVVCFRTAISATSCLQWNNDLKMLQSGYFQRIQCYGSEIIANCRYCWFC